MAKIRQNSHKMGQNGGHLGFQDGRYRYDNIMYINEMLDHEKSCIYIYTHFDTQQGYDDNISAYTLLLH